MEINDSVSKRIPWIDVLRGLAIFCIVLGHFGELAGDFYLFVFSFNVQLFFFISGMFAFKYRGKSFLSALKAFAEKILLPYSVICAVNILFFAVLNGKGLVGMASMALECLMAQRNALFSASLWFFPCLFVMSVLYYLLSSLIKNRELLLLVCLALSLAMRIFKEEPMWIWSADSAILYLFYYALGDYIMPCAKSFSFADLSRGKKAVFVVSALLTVGVALIWFTGYNSLTAQIGIVPPVIVTKLIHFAVAVVMIYFSMLLAYLLRNSRVLTRLGQSTFAVAGTEQITRLLLLEVMYLFGVDFNLNSQFRVIVYAIITVAVSYFVFAKPLASLFPKLFAKGNTEQHKAAVQ